MKKVFFFLVLFTISTSAFAEDIYVSQGGTGTGTGCSSPRSASWFNSSGNWGGGAGQINGGDTVYLCGTITTNLTMQGNGSSGNVITIDGTSATLSGRFIAGSRSYFAFQNVTLSAGRSTNYFLDFHYSSNATITNLTIPTAEAYFPVDLRGASYVTADGINISNCRYGAINMEDYNGDGTHHITLSNLNILTTNDYMASTQRDMIYTSGGHDIMIEKSLLHKRWTSQNDTEAHNDIWQLWGITSNPYIPEPYNMTLRYSKLITDDSADGNYQFLQWEGFSGTNNVYGNVFIKYGSNAGGNFIALKNPISGTTNVYNNTFVMKGTAPYFLLNSINLPSGMVVNLKNNVVYNSASSNGTIYKSGAGTFNHTYNTYYGGQSNGYLGTNCSSYASTGEVCDTNPLFTDYANDDFRIGTNSPAYNTGTDLESTYNLGLSTAAASIPSPTLIGRPQATFWDKGAYEYSGSDINVNPHLVPLAPSFLGIN